MDGTVEDAHSWQQLCEDFEALLVVDEAHSFGIMGPHGMGWLAQHPTLKNHTAVAMFGCGKALGVSGGFVVGPIPFLQALIHWAKPLVYSTGPSPFVVGALKQSWEIVCSSCGETLRKQLNLNTQHFNKIKNLYAIPHLDVHTHSPIASLYCEPTQAQTLAKKLMDKGFWIRPMRPPTVPTGTSRLRIVLHAQHTELQMENLLTHIQKEVRS